MFKNLKNLTNEGRDVGGLMKSGTIDMKHWNLAKEENDMKSILKPPYPIQPKTMKHCQIWSTSSNDNSTEPCAQNARDEAEQKKD